MQLEQPMPGQEGHLLMAPQPLNKSRFNFQNRKDARLSGVMILLYEEDGRFKFPLTERPKYDGVHSGQISLPGGKAEPNDPNLVATATRETWEEVGVPESDIKILGQLSEIYIPPSNFRVQPVIGYVDAKPAFLQQSEEVVTLIETEVTILVDPAARKEKEVKAQNGNEMYVPYFDVQGHTVWGATAMILSEFAEILKNLNAPNKNV